MGNLLRSVLKRVGVVPSHNGSLVAIDRRITYNSDGLVSVHNADFLQEARFQRSYHAGVNTPHSFGPRLHMEWRVCVAIWAAQIGKNLEGDFVECGVNSGIISRAIMEYLDFANLTHKSFYLLDTYCGIPESAGSVDRVRRMNKMYRDIYEDTAKTFAPFSNAKLVRGQIPETLSEITSESICYLSIDLNVAAPEIAAGEYLWPRMTSGAVILLDDYGWGGHEEQKAAWDKFVRERDVPLLPLPTGQAIIIKP